MLLAGDIGGTKTVLALYSPEQGPHRPLVKETFPSKAYASLEAIITTFLEKNQAYRVTHGAFGVAGPVVQDRARITNLSWVLEEERLAAAFDLEWVHLMNDLEAIATAVPILPEEKVTRLNDATARPRGAIGVVAPGTGLGEAFLVWGENGYHAYPSEGGHTDFAPANEVQQALLTYLAPRMEHVSYERVCSGLGIPNLYAFFRDTGRYQEPAWLHDALAKTDDLTPVIVRTAQEQRADICTATLDLFIDILAREAGNLALKILATGGIYLGGGIPPRILQQLQESRFTEWFTEKGRFRELLTEIPVFVIEEGQTALLGAAQDGLMMMNRQPAGR